MLSHRVHIPFILTTMAVMLMCQIVVLLNLWRYQLLVTFQMTVFLMSPRLQHQSQLLVSVPQLFHHAHHQRSPKYLYAQLMSQLKPRKSVCSFFSNTQYCIQYVYSKCRINEVKRDSFGRAISMRKIDTVFVENLKRRLQNDPNGPGVPPLAVSCKSVAKRAF